MASIPELIKELTAAVNQLNTNMATNFANLQKATAQPEDIKPVMDAVSSLSAKVDTVVSQTADTPPQ